ncbi:unnamed protein product [Zymoseptoria tritici ST99CH_3D1]|uniref:Tat pathway signal sequence n=2 Tax=Zymoseptoria tritici TaxID=1047171 RepID=A0A1X7RJR2_ZYMT9|nr:unnamed protein product [Zymoseptoria tritici ST99CH_3D7]SMR46196.1 unnamed protein product [Zymoseptoria tritici ST99CH_1E4]SMR47447.1 unnamed protein product [Zymoseptoria tritici ST99CH_3D1]
MYPYNEENDGASRSSSSDNKLESEGLLPDSPLRPRRISIPRTHLYLAWTLSLVTTAILAWTAARYSVSIESFPAKDRIASISWYSPIYNDISLDTEHVRVDGELWWNDSNIFRQDPSPETDAAWDDLLGGHANRIFVSKEDWIKSGLDPETGAQWLGDPTGETYMAEINAFHLVHCLNYLRKAAFLDYYEFMRPFNPLYWSHFYHCLDMIRQELMCTASLDLSPLVWSQHQKMPYPYFTIDRQCRRWDDIIRYRDEHQMNEEQLNVMLNATKPPHQKEIPIPDHAVTLLDNIGTWKKLNFQHVEAGDWGRNDMDGLPRVQRNPKDHFPSI